MHDEPPSYMTDEQVPSSITQYIQPRTSLSQSFSGYAKKSIGSLFNPSRFDRDSMPHFVVLGSWTEKGITNVKDTIKRAENAKAMARKLGGKLDVWYTLGGHDIVALCEMPNDEAYNKLILSVGMLGNIRTTSMKAWTQDEMSKLIDELAK